MKMPQNKGRRNKKDEAVKALSVPAKPPHCDRPGGYVRGIPLSSLSPGKAC